MIYNGMLPINNHTLNWLADDQPNGFYFIQVLIDGVPEITSKVTLLK